MRDLVLMIGTNLGDRTANINTALLQLNSFFGKPKSKSDIYETEPWGYESESLYYNVAIVYQTDLLPIELLYICKSIEIEMGRKKTFSKKYENRIIDIDIILYGDIKFSDSYLCIPHRQLPERRFVLEPLNEIVPNMLHPVLKLSINELLKKCTDKLSVRKITDIYSTDNMMSVVVPKYNYITIEGCIGAGKTSLATKLAKDFNARLILEQYADNPFLPKFYEDHDKYAFPVELSFLSSRYKQLQDSLLNTDLFHSVTVADYFLAKSYIFAGKTLTDDMFSLYANMFNIMKSKLPQPELIVYLYLSIDNLLHNINVRGRNYEKSITADYLQSIQSGYFEYFHQQKKSHIVIVDTNNIDFVRNDNDYNQLLELVSVEWPEGIEHVNL